MRLSLLALPALAGLLLTGACAPTGVPADAADRSARPCFFVHQVDNFRQTRGQTLYLKLRNDDVYQLEAAGYCQGLDFTLRLALLPEVGSSRVCAGDRATIVVPGVTQGAEACRVHVIKRLTAEELAALPAGDRP